MLIEKNSYVISGSWIEVTQGDVCVFICWPGLDWPTTTKNSIVGFYRGEGRRYQAKTFKSKKMAFGGDPVEKTQKFVSIVGRNEIFFFFLLCARLAPLLIAIVVFFQLKFFFKKTCKWKRSFRFFSISIKRDFLRQRFKKKNTFGVTSE